MQLSVAICTHNPKPHYLERVIGALRNQCTSVDQWELLLVDNASSTPLSSELIGWHPKGRVIREEHLGLTHARLCAIRQTQSPLVLFVDDDNVLHTDYLQKTLRIAQSCPWIGAWSGQSLPKFDSPPPEWTKRYWGMLVIREFSRDYWSNVSSVQEAMPNGAGMTIRRQVAQAYLHLHESGQRPVVLDRQGKSLMSGGDNDLAACACDIGLGMGLFHELQLTHLIPAGRLTEDYLARLAEGIYYSTIYLRSLRGEPTSQKSRGRRLKEFVQAWRMTPRDRRIYAACCRGENRALRELAGVQAKAKS